MTVLLKPRLSSGSQKNGKLCYQAPEQLQKAKYDCSPQIKSKTAGSFKNSLLSLLLLIGLFHQIITSPRLLPDVQCKTEACLKNYDGLGRRIQTTYQGAATGGGQSTVSYYYDPLFEFLELGHSVNGNRTWNLFGPDKSGTYGGAQGIGGLETTFIENTKSSYGVMNNTFGDAVGTITSGIFTPYQSVLGAYGPMPGSTVSTDFKPQWRGHYLDQTGFYYMGARYYEPNSGRFLSADPLGHDASIKRGRSVLLAHLKRAMGSAMALS